MLANLANIKTPEQERTVPAGNYKVTCVEAAVKSTKAGTGQYIKCTFKVDGGEQDGKKIFHNFNISNPNETAQRIGLSQLKGFLTAAGRTAETLEDVNELLGLSAEARVTVRAADIYDEQSEIRGFKALPEEMPL